MQPFDALSLKAIIEETKTNLLNRKVDRVYQLGRDELIISLRGKLSVINLFLSAHAMHGRICVVEINGETSTDKNSAQVTKRYAPPPKNSNGKNANNAPNHGQSAFSMLLKKHLTGATLVAIESPNGERTADFIFSCIDEVGTRSHKVLTAEIMGRHSNLIFWEKSSEKILTASHVVTEEMSRTREVAAGLRFVRPPSQDKPSIFTIPQANFLRLFEKLQSSGKATVEQWLISSFTGIGKNLAEEVVAIAHIPSKISNINEVASASNSLFAVVEQLQSKTDFSGCRMTTDLKLYSLLAPKISSPESSGKEIDKWQIFSSANELIEFYFRAVETKEQLQQLRERIRAELKNAIDKVESRKSAASEQLVKAGEPELLKKYGDLVLANIHLIESGQESLVCEDFYDNQTKIKISLDVNLTPSQNAQNFYRLFAKHKIRFSAASAAIIEADMRLEKLQEQINAVNSAIDFDALNTLKENVVERKVVLKKSQPLEARKKTKSKLVQLKSSDGWIIYIGRNRFENDHLLSRLAQPSDVWLHVLGQGGAHVLIKVPASKQDPPMTTLKEAAQVAARMSKATSGAKVRVVYTQCRHVKKLANEKPGLVRYENEKTLEVDTSQPIPTFMRTLFQA